MPPWSLSSRSNAMIAARDGFLGYVANLDIVQAAARRSSMLPRPFWRRKARGGSHHLRPTAYLDGIRGFAAMIVYFLHHSGEAHGDWTACDRLESAFGYRGEIYVGAFPFVRLFFSGGHFAVSIFYVVSGYVLSTKALKLIHASDHARLLDTLASSVFRRWLRLYIPVLIFSLLPIFLWQLLGVKYSVMGRDPDNSISAEFAAWWSTMWEYSFVFNTPTSPWTDYHLHIWSLPIEMKGSLLVFMTLLALGTSTKNARLLCSLALIIYLLYFVNGAFYAMFISGMMLSDLDLLAASNQLPKLLTGLKPYKDNIFLGLFAIGLWLGGVPTNRPDPERWDASVLSISPGWEYLASFTPAAAEEYKWFFLFFAATMVVASVPHMPRLKKFFESDFCQYLGRISFMFYLIHGPILWTIGVRLYSAVGAPVGSRALLYPNWQNSFPLWGFGYFGMEFNYVVVLLLLLPFTMWMGHLATVLLDDNVLRFVAWVHRLTLPNRTLPVSSPALKDAAFLA